jgi:hypothetical protein
MESTSACLKCNSPLAKERSIDGEGFLWYCDACWKEKGDCQDKIDHTLLPCPSCRIDTIVALIGGSDKDGVHQFDRVWCKSCGTTGPWFDGHSDDAVYGWNSLPRRNPQVDFAMKFLALAAKYELFDASIQLRSDGEYAPVSFILNVNDIFCPAADGEVVDDVDALEKAITDCIEASPTDAVSVWQAITDGLVLYVARKRNERPLRLKYTDNQALWPLFDACGLNKVEEDIKQYAKKSTEEKPNVDGKSYRKCLAWRNSAGNGHACLDMCIEAQRLACNAQQEDDGKRCSQCDNVKLANPVKATFRRGDERFCCTEFDVEFCSEACAAAYGTGKERLK